MEESIAHEHRDSVDQQLPTTKRVTDFSPLQKWR